jgi:hypothetical protein
MDRMKDKAQVALFEDGSWELITTEWTDDHDTFGAGYMTDEQVEHIEILHPLKDYSVVWMAI